MADEEFCGIDQIRGDFMIDQGKTRETKNESITGHGKGSKIGFLFDAYYAVVRYTRAGRNCEMRFQTIKIGSGLPNFLDFCIA